MIKRSPFTIVLGGKAEPEPETAVRAPCVTESDSIAAPATTVFFSSQHKTAIALVNAASEQAIQRASGGSGVDYAPRSPVLRDRLVDGLEEHRHDIIQCANAAQARRAADCTRRFVEALLRHTTQPCFALDEVGAIAQWNAAMARWTGIPECDALSLPLSRVFCADAAIEIEAANLLLRAAEAQRADAETDAAYVLEGEFNFRDDIAAVRISLLPLCRLPQIVETVVVLMTPVSSADA